MRGIKNREISNTQVQDRLSTGFVLLFLTLYLLLWPKDGYEVIAAWKYRLFLLLSLLYIGLSLLVWGELWLVSSHDGQKKRRRFAFHAFHLPWLYLLFTTVSALLSDYPGVFWGNGRNEGVLTIGIYVALFSLLRKYFHPRKWLLFVFGGSVSLFCLLGLIQLTGANPLTLYPEGYNFYGAGVYYPGQYWSTVGNVNLCAALLALAAGIFAAAYIRNGRGIGWLFLIPLSLSVFSICALDSEAGLVALMGGLILLPPFLVRTMGHLGNLLLTYGAVFISGAAGRAVRFYDGGFAVEPGKTAWLLAAGGAALLLAGAAGRRWLSAVNISPGRLRKALAIGSVAAVLAGIAAVYVFPALPDGFLQQAHELLHGHWDDSFGSSRLYIWRQTWALIKEKPLWGGGPDTLGLRGLEGFSRYNETLGHMVKSGIDAAHNEYLHIWVNQGLFALLSYLAFLVCACVRWWKSKEDQAALAGSSVLLYGIQAFFGISSCITTPYLWLTLAVLEQTKNGEEDER